MAAVVLGGCQGGTDAGAAGDKGSAGTGAPESSPAYDGTAALPADEILRQSRAALRQAKSYSAEGELRGKYATVDNGETNPVKVEVIGKNYHETIQFDAYKLEVLSVGGQVYMRADEEFWDSLKTGITGDKDTWIKMGTVKEAFDSGTFRALDIDAMFKLKGPFTTDLTAMTGDDPQVSVDDADGPLLYVSAVGEPYPTQINPAPGTVLGFSGFGDDYTGTVKKPAASDIDTSLYDWTHSNAE